MRCRVRPKQGSWRWRTARPRTPYGPEGLRRLQQLLEVGEKARRRRAAGVARYLVLYMNSQTGGARPIIHDRDRDQPAEEKERRYAVLVQRIRR